MSMATALTPAESVPSATRDRTGAIVKTAAALLSVQGMTWLTSLVSLLVVPRYLGAGNLGIWATAGTLASIAALVASWGTANQLIKDIARQPEGAASLFVHVVALRLAIWSCFALLIAAVTVVMIDDFTIRVVIFLMLAGGAVGLIGSAASSALQGNQTIGVLSFIGAVLGAGSQAAIILVLMRGGGLIGLALVGTGAVSAVAVVSVVLFWRKLGRRVSLSKSAVIGVASGGVAFLAWDVALQTYASIDYVLLAALTDSKTVGEYAFALRLSAIPAFVATVVTASIYPALAAAAHSDRAFFKRVLTEGTRIVIVVSLPMATGLIVLAPQLTRLIGGGHQYDEAVPLLIILCIQIPLVAIDTVLGTGLFALDKQRRLAIVGWCAAVLNPAINLAAIPLTVHWFNNGAIGAAVITAATECFVGGWIWVTLGPRLEHRKTFSVIGRSLLACLVMGTVVYVAQPHTGVFAAIPLGAAIYGLLAHAFGLVSLSEAKRLRAALGRKDPEPALA